MLLFSIRFKQNFIIQSEYFIQISNLYIYYSEDNPNNKLAFFQQTFSDEFSFQDSIKKYENQVKLQGEHIVRILNHGYSYRSEFCSSTWEHNFLFEFVDHDIAQDIEIRQKFCNQMYKENELFQICYSVLVALLEMQQNNMTHGDICAKNILIDFNGKIKIMPNNILQTQNNLKLLLGMDKSIRCYLSPQQIEQMKNNQIEQEYNTLKSDLFSLGVVLMEVALLKSVDDIYYLNMFELNELKIKQNLNKIKETYSDNMSSIIRKLMTIDENLRPNPNLLVQIIDDLQQEKIIDVSDRLYSMNDVMREPINLITNCDTSRFKQQADIMNKDTQKKRLIDIQPISHMDINMLNSINENNFDSVYASLISKNQDFQTNNQIIQSHQSSNYNSNQLDQYKQQQDSKEVTLNVNKMGNSIKNIDIQPVTNKQLNQKQSLYQQFRNTGQMPNKSKI